MPSKAAIDNHFKHREAWERRIKIMVATVASVDPNEGIDGGPLADACVRTAISIVLQACGWKPKSEAEMARMASQLRLDILETLQSNGPPELATCLATSAIDNN